MIRGGVATLGGLVTLAGLFGAAAWAEDSSLLSWSSLAPFIPSPTGVFPQLPENWSDLPVQFHISESFGYDSNIANTPNPTSSSSVSFRPIGSLESISSYGVSFKNEIGANQLFADGTWGVYRYLSDTRYNSQHSALDLGDNFTYSKCSGSVRLSEQTSPAEPSQQLAVNVINSVTAEAATENLNCKVNGNYSAIFNSGFSATSNTATLDKTNDSQSLFIAAGIDYAVTETNSLQVLATLTGTDYTNRQQLANTLGLLNKLTTDEILATYTKNFGPSFSLSAQFGLLGVLRDEFFSLSVPRTILPEYSFRAQWSATPKLQFYAIASRLVASPTSVLSNLQVTESAGAGLTYAWTPKISFGANVQTSYGTSAATSARTAAVFGQIAASQRSYSAGVRVGYEVTPFLAASLSYQYFRSLQLTTYTDTSVILLALNFNPI